ncbi:hypothetical protein PHLCEN_2v8591 [Hermanssonia centrifuga]|uniref:Uncharacterized protein n=1 Tax=Hermanssonia centrifuga TaxID=98765 RepID=A0A2R6NT37_9APHY|nr:hypothetical protein PHLCEN_2v8591 [Hermanssonia centrifuga]
MQRSPTTPSGAQESRQTDTSDPFSADRTQGMFERSQTPSSPAAANGNGHSNQVTSVPTTPDTQYATYTVPPLLDSERPSGARLPSYATVGNPNEKVAVNALNPDGTSAPITMKPWVPVPLRPWFWIPLVCLMAGGGIAFEVALHFSKKEQGWSTKGDFSTEQGLMHYVYTLPPVAISMIFAGVWAWTDIEIRRLQPYVDLAQGNSPPQRSLLLDYTRDHTFYVWTVAARNRHWLVSLGSLLVMLTFSFQPLAAALFNVQDIFQTDPQQIVGNLGAIGLNQNGNFEDLTSFLTAAGYASANVLYGIGDPSFIHNGFTVAPFEIPNIGNGTVLANTTAVLSEPHCVAPDQAVSMVQLADGWNNSATFNDCTFSWNVSKASQNLFGVNPVPDSTSCASLTAIPEQFRPIIFWFFTYIPAPMASVSLCTPSITLWDASVTVDIASNNLTSVVPIGPLGSHNGTAPALAQFAGNVTGDPLDGRAYNGLFFNLNDSADPFTLGRQTAIQLALPAAVFQAAEIFGLTEAFQQNMFANLSVDVYVSWSLPFFCFAGENRLIDQLAADNVFGPCSQDGVFFGYGTAPHHRDDDHP